MQEYTSLTEWKVVSLHSHNGTKIIVQEIIAQNDRTFYFKLNSLFDGLTDICIVDVLHAFCLPFLASAYFPI